MNATLKINDDKLIFSYPSKKGERTQVVSFTYENTLKARDYCTEKGFKLLVDPELKEWIRVETLRRNWPLEMIPFDSKLGQALSHREFQREGIEFAVKHRNILIADEPGLGKTLQAMGSVIESGCAGSILVVAPKSAAYVTWPHELASWLHEIAPYDEWIVIGGNMSKLERIRAQKRVLRWDLGKGRIGPRQWVIVSPNYLRFKVKID